MIKTYTNRYNDVYTFTQDQEGNILWGGSFEWCRFSMPNDYSRAYAEYLRDGGDIELKEFKIEVHKYDDNKREYILGDKYIRMVDSLKDKICMVDPSGGPHISVGMSLTSFGFKDCIVKDFERIETGYKIIVK